MQAEKIKWVREMDDTIGDFVHNEFARYGEQNNVVLNYDEFCLVAENSDGKIIGVITGWAYYNEVQAFHSDTAGNGRLVRNKVEEAILNQSRRLVAEPEADLSLLELRDFELDEIPSA